MSSTDDDDDKIIITSSKILTRSFTVSSALEMTYLKTEEIQNVCIFSSEYQNFY